MKRIIQTFSVVLILSLLVLGSCWNDAKTPEPLKIAISKAIPEKTYINYVNWLKTADSTIEYYDLYHLNIDSAISLLKECNGLLLTGGTDIYPGKYGKENDTAHCWKPDFKRDSLEFLLVKIAIEKNIPILGICRGLQLMNVHFGGSLIIDFPTDLDTLIIHQTPKTYDTYHEVQIKKGTLLYDITGQLSGMVNSNHHQGIDVLAGPLEGLAYTEDYLIESVSLKYYEEHPFLLGVQWHPERMDYTNPLSGKIVERFLEEAKLNIQ